VLFAEFFTAMGEEGLIDRHMPKPGSSRGSKATCSIKSLSMMLYGGDETIEDVRELREDSLREVLGLGEIPSSSAIADWLRSVGQRGGIEGMEKVNGAIARKVLKREDIKGYTLIVDPTSLHHRTEKLR